MDGKKAVPIILLWLLCSSCVSNLQNFQSDVVCPVEYVFHADFDRTWEASMQAVLSLSAVDEMDRKKGIITSDIALVDGRTFQSPDQALFGHLYKYSYRISLTPTGRGLTRINTDVRLYYEKMMGAKRYETRWNMVENYLRDKLYRRICANLFPGGNGPCANGFTGMSSVVQAPETVTRKRSRRVRRPDPQVQMAQQILAANDYDPGPTDGLMGKKTRNALKKFQEDNGLTPSGRIDAETRRLLNEYRREDTGVGQTSTAPAREAAAPERRQPVKKAEKIRLTAPKQEQYQQPPPPAPKPKKVHGKYVTTDTADLLKEEDLYGSEIIATIPANTVLKVLSQDGEYYKVSYRGRQGFVYTEFVKEQ